MLADSPTHHLPYGLPWNTQLPNPGLCVQLVRGQEISLSPWGLLGIAGSLEQLPAAAGDREPRNACASLAFLGSTVLLLKSLGSTGPHSGPHCWYILSHYERNLERDDSSFGQCRTSSWLSCQFLHFPAFGPPLQTTLLRVRQVSAKSRMPGWGLLGQSPLPHSCPSRQAWTGSAIAQPLLGIHYASRKLSCSPPQRHSDPSSR